MTDDQPKRVSFDRSVVKTALPAQERYVLAVLRKGGVGGSQQATVREVIRAGLEHLGWPPSRCELVYAEYRLQCLRSDQPNEFEVTSDTTKRAGLAG